MSMSAESFQAAKENAGLAEPGQTSAEYAEAEAAAPAAEAAESDRPAGNASRDEWADYVDGLPGGNSEGQTRAELIRQADGLGG